LLNLAFFLAAAEAGADANSKDTAHPIKIPTRNITLAPIRKDCGGTPPLEYRDALYWILAIHAPTGPAAYVGARISALGVRKAIELPKVVCIDGRFLRARKQIRKGGPQEVDDLLHLLKVYTQCLFGNVVI
jgi:hypothetical protein